MSGLAPLILTARPKPPQPPKKFQQLQQTVARRLGSLDPAWLQRCQGTPGDGGTTPGAARDGEQGEVGWAPPEPEQGAWEPSVGDSRRKRPRRDGDGGNDEAVAPAKLRRCRRGSAEGAFGAAGAPKQSEEEEKEEERVAARKESRTLSDPSENLLGDFEDEEEKPRPTRRAGTAR